MTTYYRTGRHVGRTIYRQVNDRPSDQDELIGVMDTPELAAQVVDALNWSLRSEQLANRLSEGCGCLP